MRLCTVFLTLLATASAQAGAFGPGTFRTTGTVPVTFENDVTVNYPVGVAGKETLYYGDSGGLVGGHLTLVVAMFGHWEVLELYARRIHRNGSRYYRGHLVIHGRRVSVGLQLGWPPYTDAAGNAVEPDGGGPQAENAIGVSASETSSQDGWGFGWGERVWEF